MKDIIGFVGYPHPNLIKELKEKYPLAKWLDLDVDLSHPNTKILPQAYCQIIKNIINNAVFYKDKIICILMAVGREKCDANYFLAKILKNLGFNIIESRFEQNLSSIYVDPNKLISQSNLPLREKIERITKSIIYDKVDISFDKSIANFGFWGVPPNDLSILDLFPNSTHIFGWTKCVEMKRPFDLELEMQVDENLPIVFYSQTFCYKSQLAKYLAEKYNGLYIDIDDFATNSVKAKIEAFIKLR